MADQATTPQELTIDELKAKLAEETKRANAADAQVEELTKQLEEAETTVVELNSRISKAESKGMKVLPNVKLGKDTYSFISEPGNVPPFGVLQAEEIASDSAELKHLVKIKASCLVLVPNKSK